MCLCAHVRTRAYVRTLDNPESTRFLPPAQQPTTRLSAASLSFLDSDTHPPLLCPFTPIYPSIHPSIHPSIYPIIPSYLSSSPSLAFSLSLSLSLSLSPSLPVSLSLPPFYFTRTCAHIHDALP